MMPGAMAQLPKGFSPLPKSFAHLPIAAFSPPSHAVLLPRPTSRRDRLLLPSDGPFRHKDKLPWHSGFNEGHGKPGHWPCFRFAWQTDRTAWQIGSQAWRVGCLPWQKVPAPERHDRPLWQAAASNGQVYERSWHHNKDLRLHQQGPSPHRLKIRPPSGRFQGNMGEILTWGGSLTHSNQQTEVTTPSLNR